SMLAIFSCLRRVVYYSFSFLNNPLKKPFVLWLVSLVASTAFLVTSARSFHFCPRSLLMPAVCLIPSSRFSHRFLKNVCSGTRRRSILPVWYFSLASGLLSLMMIWLTRNDTILRERLLPASGSALREILRLS